MVSVNIAQQLRWLVTACTSGFGEQLVLSILARFDRRIASGRQASLKLEPLQATGAGVEELDASLNQQKLDGKIELVANTCGGINVSVNNAGDLQSGLFEQLTYVAQ